MGSTRERPRRREDRGVRYAVFALVGWTALTAVAVGAEVWRGRAVMRVAAELETQLGLRCPDAWGRQEGEVLRALDAADLRRQALIHGSIWILGCLGILVALADHRRQASGEAAAERRKAEAELQLSAARRLEAVGRLSAGLAHDFNNLLAPILTVSGVVKDELPPGSPLREDLEDIRDAARKARDLVRALQTLSRRNGASLERIALASVVAESEDLLRRFAGARLGFSLHVGEGVPAVVADRPLVELALANLVVNAREGGVIGKTIRMSVGSVDVSRAEATRILVRQGRHAAVTVAEAGVDASLLSGLTGFTAAQGAAGADAGGAGFGLPTINGIVAQYGGGVVVRQASDAGWIVRLLLPEASAQLDQSG